MRVLHVLETLAAGGVETTFLNVLRHLPRRDMSHDVLAFAGGALEGEYRRSARVFIGRDSAMLQRLLADEPYDVVYVLFERCAERVLPLVVTRTETRVVYGKNYDFSGQWRSTEGFVSNADSALLEACDSMTFTTRPLQESYGATGGRGIVLGKGADVSGFMQLAPADEETPERIVAIANPHPRKRLSDLVQAMAHVRAQVPKVDLRIVGTGDPHEVARLRTLAAAIGVGDCVSLAAGTRDVAAELSGARVLALPSGSEGVPTVVLEAMAAARPVVVTDAGHTRSIVDDGVEGFVVPIGDVSALADRLVRTLTDRTLAHDMGIRGRARAARHCVEAIADRLSMHLRAVVATPWH